MVVYAILAVLEVAVFVSIFVHHFIVGTIVNQSTGS